MFTLFFVFTGLPDEIDRLILLLGLGSTGRNVQPGKSAYSVNFNRIQSTCPNYAGLVCTDIAEPHGRRKRSSEFAVGSVPKNSDSSLPEFKSHPQQFNMQKHGRRLRRQASPSCHEDPSATKYVLFLLDTSGSIGENDFTKAKIALSNLIKLFCKPIQVAVLSFNHEYKLEFCFNCHENDNNGRYKTATAIRDIEYRSGFTHTGGAAKCVCDQVLHPSCGLPSKADCIDVVFITDGKSNDPSREICNEVQCLHNRKGVNTYAIGINNYNEDELECIAKTSNLLNIFKFRDFLAFAEALKQLEERLVNEALSEDPYACYDTQDEAK